MPVDQAALHALEVALRDSRNMDVIRALSRLTVMPKTQDQLHAAVHDMNVVRTFIEQRMSGELQAVATQVFAEHGEEMRRVFKSVREGGRTGGGQ